MYTCTGDNLTSILWSLSLCPQLSVRGTPPALVVSSLSTWTVLTLRSDDVKSMRSTNKATSHVTEETCALICNRRMNTESA
jgi:hypothetical protein